MSVFVPYVEIGEPSAVGVEVVVERLVDNAVGMLEGKVFEYLAI